MSADTLRSIPDLKLVPALKSVHTLRLVQTLKFFILNFYSSFFIFSFSFSFFFLFLVFTFLVLFLARATKGTSLYVWVRQLVSQWVFIFGQCCQTSWKVARLRLMSQMGLWGKFYPIFWWSSLLYEKIYDFMDPLKSVPSPSLHNLSCACFPTCCLLRNFFFSTP